MMIQDAWYSLGLFQLYQLMQKYNVAHATNLSKVEQASSKKNVNIKKIRQMTREEDLLSCAKV